MGGCMDNRQTDKQTDNQSRLFFKYLVSDMRHFGGYSIDEYFSNSLNLDRWGLEIKSLAQWELVSDKSVK